MQNIYTYKHSEWKRSETERDLNVTTAKRQNLNHIQLADVSQKTIKIKRLLIYGVKQILFTNIL